MPVRGRHVVLLLTAVTLGLGCCDKRNIPHQIQALISSNARERSQAALALARCGDDAAAAVPRLSRLLYDSNPGVQSAAAYALHRIDTPAARAVMDAIQAHRAKERERPK